MNIPIKVALIMGKMDSGGKKNLVMEYFRHSDPNQVRYCFICDEDSDSVPEKEISELGGEVEYVAPYQRIFRNIDDIESVLKRGDFDIVHAYNSTMNVFSLLAAKRAGVPVRISESLSMAHPKERKTGLKKVLRLFSSLYATDFMCCGEDCGRWQFGDTRYSNGEVCLFRTAIDTERYVFDRKLRNQVRVHFGLQEKTVFGFIGRFAPQKNPLFLLDIFNEICHSRADAHLLLIGDGPLRASIEDKIEVYALQEKVTYLGKREDILQFYNAMDCFLLPSLYEGLPVVGIEAQCCGLPIFFSDRVTREVSFTPLASFVPLNRSADVWAETILETLPLFPERVSYGAIAQANGFDSLLETERLVSFYQKRVREIA